MKTEKVRVADDNAYKAAVAQGRTEAFEEYLNSYRYLAYLHQVGAISSTQMQSAYKRDGKTLTEDARSDIRKMMLFNILNGGADGIEAAFESLPDRVKKALPQSMAGDMRLEEGDRLLPDVQKAIMACVEVSEVAGLVRTIVGGGDVMATAVRLKKLLADARQRHEENTVLFGDEDFTGRDRAIAREAYERIQDLIDSLRTNPAEAERIGLDLDDVVKIVNVYYPDMRKKQNDTKNIFFVSFLCRNFVAICFTILLVVQPGLEPRLADPESDVLPLHHWTALLFFQKRLQRYTFFCYVQKII